MSCGLRDITGLELEQRPAVLVHTDLFEDAAARQSEMLGQPALRRVSVPHPIQQLDASEVRELARNSVDTILRAVLDRA